MEDIGSRSKSSIMTFQGISAGEKRESRTSKEERRNIEDFFLIPVTIVRNQGSLKVSCKLKIMM